MATRWPTIVTAGLLWAVLETSGGFAAPKETPARLRQHALLKSQKQLRPNSLVFSPDGKILASLEDEKGAIRLWDVAAGKSAGALRHRREVYQVAFSPDGKTIASCGDRKINLWDTKSLKNLAFLPVGWSVYSVHFNADGKTLLAVEKDYLALWSLEKKEEVSCRETRVPPYLTFAYLSKKKPAFAVHEKGRGGFALRDATTGATIWSAQGHERPIVGFAVAGDEKTLATVDALAVRLWNRDTGENTATLEHPPDVIFSPLLRPNGRNYACALNHDGRILVCAYEYQVPNGPRGGGFRLYALPGGKLLADISDKADIISLAFSPEGRTLATGFRTDIELWSIPAAWSKKGK